MKEKKIALVGIGNILRGDDGLGNYIIEAFASLKMNNVNTFAVHQLQIELLEELQYFDAVIFVDASLKKDALSFEKVHAGSFVPTASSHRMDAEMLVQLSKKLYHSNTCFYSCAVKGYHFEMGNNLSPQAKANAKKAIEKIVSFIKSSTNNQ
jgi:hydrogenase maturation protease